MVYSHTPTYYSSLHNTITSICKNILPFSSSSLKKWRLLPAEQKLSKQQSDNLKWQQESYHRILNLIGLRNEGIVQESKVSAFRSQLLDTLIASSSPTHQEHPTIIRDKLLFLQELLHTKCISGEEYHSSKRPLLQKLAVQGAEIEARDVIVAGPKLLMEKNSEEEEEWSVIDFKDDECCLMKGKESRLNPSKNTSPSNPMKQWIKGEGASMINLIVNTTPYRSDKNKGEKLGKLNQSLGAGSPFPENTSSTMNQIHGGGGGGGCFRENPFWKNIHNESKEKESESRSILMSESKPPLLTTDQVKKKKKKAFPTSLFKQREQRNEEEEERSVAKSATMDTTNSNTNSNSNSNNNYNNKKKNNHLGFDVVVGFKKWKRSNWNGEEEEEQELQEDEDEYCTAPLTIRGR